MTTVGIATITKNRYATLINLIESELMNVNYYGLHAKDDFDAFLLRSVCSYVRLNLFHAFYVQITYLNSDAFLTADEAVKYVLVSKEERNSLNYRRNQASDSYFEFEQNILNFIHMYHQSARDYFNHIHRVYSNFIEFLNKIMFRLVAKDKNILNVLWNKRYYDALLPQMINNEIVKMYLLKSPEIGNHQLFVEKLYQLFLEEHQFDLI